MSLPSTPWELLDLKCTVTQIQELLREFRLISSDIRIGAVKDEVIRNVREAVGAHLIPIERVHELIQDSEENGDQHIFFFRPKNGAVAKKYRDAESVGKAIFDSKWESSGRFPQFDLKPEDFTWADFRRPRVGESKHGWVAKVYGHEIRLKLKRVKDSPNTVTRIYDKIEDRLVCVARWNHPELLEIRVPRASSRERIRKRLEKTWEMLGAHLKTDDFQPWSLRKALRRMLIEAKQNADTYVISDAKLTDSESGIASFSTNTEEESLSSAKERDDAVNTYLKGGGECRQVAIMLDPDAARGIFGESHLRVIAGGHNEHEIIIQATTNRLAVDYVANQLRKFDR